MKIKIKLFFSFLAVTLPLLVVGFVLINAAHKDLERSISNASVGQVDDTLDAIDREIYSRIEDSDLFVTRPLIQQAVMASNVEFERKSDISGYIKENDEAWINTGADQLSPLMRAVIEDERSQDLRNRIEFFEKKIRI